MPGVGHVSPISHSTADCTYKCARGLASIRQQSAHDKYSSGALHLISLTQRLAYHKNRGLGSTCVPESNSCWGECPSENGLNVSVQNGLSLSVQSGMHADTQAGGLSSGRWALPTAPRRRPPLPDGRVPEGPASPWRAPGSRAPGCAPGPWPSRGGLTGVP